MSKNLGSKAPVDMFNEGSNYDSVVFNVGAPLLGAELNLAQELPLSQIRKAISSLRSGWVSTTAPYFTDGSEEKNCFYTQDPSSPTPEVAMVNGWAIHVQNTNTTVSNLNKILLASTDYQVLSGARADGIYLEVWRGLVAPSMEGITTPVKSSVVPNIKSIHTISKDKSFAVGDEGTLVRYNGDGVWETVQVPTVKSLNAIAFNEGGSMGFAVGDGGEVLRSDDSGNNWHKVQGGTSSRLLAVAVSTSSSGKNLVLAVGEDGAIIESKDNGLSFSPQVVLNGGSRDLHSVVFIPGSNGLASVIAGVGGLLAKRVTPGQSSWVKCSIVPASNGNLPTQADLFSVRMASAAEGYACGSNGMALKTIDGGASWLELAPTANSTLAQTTLTSMVVADPGKLRLSVKLTPGAVPYFKGFSYDVDSTKVTFNLIPTSVGTSGSMLRAVLLKDPGSSSNKTVSDLLREIQGMVFESPIGSSSLFEATIETDTVMAVSGLVSSTDSAKLGMSIGSSVYFLGSSGTSPMVFTLSEVGMALDPYSQWQDQLANQGMGSILCSSYISDDFILVGGESASILSLDNTQLSPVWQFNICDIYQKTVRKVFGGGNFLSPASLQVSSDYIHPNVGLETSGRVQVQYALRVMPGIDPISYPDSGLGSSACSGQGPNPSPIGGSFENMGSATGDFGLYRSVCPNTVDGYSYAIPMFVLHRRNNTAFDPISNINGVTIDGASVSPDGKYNWQITKKDVTDVRRTVFSGAVGLKEKAFASILSGSLSTKVGFSGASGTQYGSTHLVVDRFEGSALPLANAGKTPVNSLSFAGIALNAIPSTGSLVSDLGSSGLYVDPANPAAYGVGYNQNGSLLPLPVGLAGIGTNKLTLYPLDANFSFRLQNPLEIMSGKAKVILERNGQIFTTPMFLRAGLEFAFGTGFSLFLTEDMVFSGGYAEASVYSEVSAEAFTELLGKTEILLIPIAATQALQAVVVQVAAKYVTKGGSQSPFSNYPVEPLSVKMYSPASAIGTQEYFLGVNDSEAYKLLHSEPSPLDPAYLNKVYLDASGDTPAVRADVFAKVKLLQSLTDDIFISPAYLTIPKQISGFSILGVYQVQDGKTGVVYPVERVEVGYMNSTGGMEYGDIRVLFRSGYNPPVDMVVRVVAETFNTSSISAFPLLAEGSSVDIGSSTVDTFRSSNLAQFSVGNKGLGYMQRTKVSVVKVTSGSSVSSFNMPSDLTSLASMGTTAGNVSYVWFRTGKDTSAESFFSVKVTVANGVITLVDTGIASPSEILVPGYQKLKVSDLMGQTFEVSYLAAAPQSLDLGESVSVEVLDYVDFGLANSTGGFYLGEESSIDKLPGFLAQLPGSIEYPEFDLPYTYKGMRTPGTGSRTHNRKLSAVVANVPSVLKLNGKITMKGDTVYTSADKDVYIRLEDSLEMGSRKLVVPILVKVLSGNPQHRGELMLALACRSARVTQTNELSILSTSSKTKGGTTLSFYRIPGLPSLR